MWIYVGLNSTATFNAIINNAIQLCPIYAKQYISGTWISKAAKSWHSGKWVEWLATGTLYWDGIHGVEWTKQNTNGASWSMVDPTFTETRMILAASGPSNDDLICGVYTKNKVDITGYSELVVEIEGSVYAATGSPIIASITTNPDNYWKQSSYAIASTTLANSATNPIIIVPYSATGYYYINISVARMATAPIKRVYLR